MREKHLHTKELFFQFSISRPHRLSVPTVPRFTQFFSLQLHPPPTTSPPPQTRIKLLLRTLNDINLQGNDNDADNNGDGGVSADYGNDDDDDDDDDNDDDDGVKGRPNHSVPSVRFEQSNDNDAWRNRADCRTA